MYKTKRAKPLTMWRTFINQEEKDNSLKICIEFMRHAQAFTEKSFLKIAFKPEKMHSTPQS